MAFDVEAHAELQTTYPDVETIPVSSVIATENQEDGPDDAEDEDLSDSNE